MRIIPEGIRTRKKDWRFWTMGAALALFVAAVLMFGVLEITSQPLFCSSCHYMKEYYTQWRNSSHKNVSCLVCHTKPGIRNYVRRKFEAVHEVVSMVTGKYPARPHAEVDDASCLRPGCHETRLLKGTEKFKGGVLFDHVPHLTQERKGKRLRCTSCHAQMAMGSHIAVTEEVCFLCHFKSVAQGRDTLSSGLCKVCHKVPQGPVAIRGTKLTYDHADYVKNSVQCTDCHGDVVSGNGEVPRVMCQQCHNKSAVYDRFQDHEFMHENHVSRHKVECYMCHSEIRHKAPAGQQRIEPAACAQCHGNGHEAVAALYRGEGGRGVANAPSSMFLAEVDCIGCHRTRTGDIAAGMPTRRPAGPEGCVACHDEDGAAYLADWKKQIAAAQAGADAALRSASAVSSAINANPEARQLLDDARHNIEFVRAAGGVHNVSYALDVLDKSSTMAKKAVETAARR